MPLFENGKNSEWILCVDLSIPGVIDCCPLFKKEVTVSNDFRQANALLYPSLLYQVSFVSGHWLDFTVPSK